MLLKAADDKSPAIETLQQFLDSSNLSATQRKAIIKELAIMRAGIKGEKEAAYELDFHFKDSKNSILLHDLRFEINGRVAQIDHLLINRILEVYVLETKHFNSGVKINELGEFVSWNSYKKCYEGIPSPIEQNERHIDVLREVIKKIAIPKRVGITLKPKMISYVLVSKNARIDRAEGFDSSSVIKCDAFYKTMRADADNMGVVDLFGSLGKIISRETLEKIGRQLKYSHKPITIDYAAKFGITEKPMPLTEKVAKAPAPAPAPAIVAPPSHHVCSKCSSDNTEIVYGRYGYYFKCGDCDGNTAIKLKCITDECKPRIRKQGLRFFEECANCNSSKLYHENSMQAINEKVLTS